MGAVQLAGAGSDLFGNWLPRRQLHQVDCAGGRRGPPVHGDVMNLWSTWVLLPGARVRGTCSHLWPRGLSVRARLADIGQGQLPALLDTVTLASLAWGLLQWHLASSPRCHATGTVLSLSGPHLLCDERNTEIKFPLHRSPGPDCLCLLACSAKAVPSPELCTNPFGCTTRTQHEFPSDRFQPPRALPSPAAILQILALQSSRSKYFDVVQDGLRQLPSQRLSTQLRSDTKFETNIVTKLWHTAAVLS